MARRSASVVLGPARVDGRTKDLIPRLAAGDVAVIDHEDLDRVAAEGLVEARPAAIVNASASISGRYPNVGPLLVAAAGIPLVDGVGHDVMSAVAEGDVIRVEGSDVYVGDRLVGAGVRQDLHTLEAAYEESKSRLGTEITRFAENTLEYVRREQHLVLERPKVPPLKVDIRGRHVLIVVRGADYREDLAHLRAYVQEVRPVLIAVDGGADALVEHGLRPDIIIGDFDSVSEGTLRCGAQLIVHAYPGGRAPGADRLRDLGLTHDLMESAGTSEDVAMLLAFDSGAELIVAVGTHASMVEFLDKGRAGMASTFLVRLLVGPILVDAKGVSRLYQSRIRPRELYLFLGSVLLAFVVIGLAFYPLRVFLRALWLLLRTLW